MGLASVAVLAGNIFRPADEFCERQILPLCHRINEDLRFLRRGSHLPRHPRERVRGRDLIFQGLGD
jgi:hypothetical protein